MQFTVPDMSCGHCTAAIETALKNADPGADVTCELNSHTVTVTSGLSAKAVLLILHEAGYPAETAG